MIEMFGKERKVLGCQLILERFGRGGDDDAPARDDARHEIGEGLARTRSRFDNKVVAFDD